MYIYLSHSFTQHKIIKYMDILQDSYSATLLTTPNHQSIFVPSVSKGGAKLTLHRNGF